MLSDIVCRLWIPFILAWERVSGTDWTAMLPGISGCPWLFFVMANLALCSARLSHELSIATSYNDLA